MVPIRLPAASWMFVLSFLGMVGIFKSFTYCCLIREFVDPESMSVFALCRDFPILAGAKNRVLLVRSTLLTMNRLENPPWTIAMMSPPLPPLLPLLPLPWRPLLFGAH